MSPDPVAGRPLGAPARSRMIIATQDGVFLWPGIALTRGKDKGFESLDATELANLIGHFYGPQAISLPIRTALRKAATYLESKCSPLKLCELSRPHVGYACEIAHSVGMLRFSGSIFNTHHELHGAGAKKNAQKHKKETKEPKETKEKFSLRSAG